MQIKPWLWELSWRLMLTVGLLVVLAYASLQGWL